MKNNIYEIVKKIYNGHEEVLKEDIEYWQIKVILEIVSRDNKNTHLTKILSSYLYKISPNIILALLFINIQKAYPFYIEKKKKEKESESILFLKKIFKWGKRESYYNNIYLSNIPNIKKEIGYYNESI